MILRTVFFIVLAIFGARQVYGQLSFCNGVGGPPIYNEDFGQGTDQGPELPVGVTNYNYINGVVDDGEYTRSSNIQRALTAGHVTGDHTGNTNGKALVVNADFTPGIFYQTSINGLCENTSYEFSAWLLNIYDPGSNVCPSPIPINVRFEIWDSTDSQMLAGGSTGNIRESASPDWQQAGLTFTTEVGQGTIILKMINNGAGGCGNDLAIDDIQFKTCGDNTDITISNGNTSRVFCKLDSPVSETLYATVENSVYASPVYQWQVSRDGINFTDIQGEDGDSYTTGMIDQTSYYRARVAEDVVNLDNNSCNNYTSIFEFKFAEDPVVPEKIGTDFLICDGVPITLETDPPSGAVVDWYDAMTGGNLLASGRTTFEASVGGFYYAESRLAEGGCVSQERIEFKVQEGMSPHVSDETIIKCPGEQIILEAGAQAKRYLWSTGETTRSIAITAAGTYDVELTGDLGCRSTRGITVVNVEPPIIENVVLEGNFIRVEASGNSELLYSIDGRTFHESNVFELPEDPIGTVFVTDTKRCTVVSQDYQFLIIPAYFTPNDDGYNDRWTIRGLRIYNDVKLSVFDRFGKLLKQVPAAPYQWDGNYRGRPLPSSTYWYVLKADGRTIKGKVLLKH